MQKIEYIPIHLLHPHPDNPRKDLGELTELAESIRAKGVLQNLTVVPAEEGGYRIIIGHRRHAAAQLAGLTDLPCVVADMTPQEQFETMMVENVHRSDLTVYEQAEGFQMMLDMGGSVEQVAQKTGFSETTIRRRVKLLELDRKKFHKAEDRGGSMADYLKLNEIQDPAVRNTVLDTIGTPNFTNALKKALEEQAFKKKYAATLKMLQEADWCRERTDENIAYYGGDYKSVANFDQWSKKPITKPADTDVADYIYTVSANTIYLYRKGPEKEKPKDPAKERKEQFSKKSDKIAKQLESISKTHQEMREEFVQRFTAFNSYQMDIEAFAAKALLYQAYGVPSIERLSRVTGVPVIKGKRSDDSLDQEIWNKMLFNQPLRALLGAAYARLERGPVNCYMTRKWDEKAGFFVSTHKQDGTLDLIYEGLGSIGYEMSDEEIQMQNGSHPLFQEAKDLVAEYKKGGKK